MSTREIKNIIFTCDGCEFTFAMNTSSEYQCPNGWAKVQFDQEGGGHYGLPHRTTVWDLCPSCKDKNIPEGSFNISRKS